MKFLDSRILVRSLPLFFVAALFLLLTVPNPLLLNQETDNQTQRTVEVENKENTNQIDLKDGGNSVKVEVNNQVQDDSNNQSNTTQRTCKVTKNGVTEIIPSDQVNIDENSSGDISIKVKCENKSSSTNQTTIRNKIDIKANSSP